jgi:diaminopimelate decarboxylase
VFENRPIRLLLEPGRYLVADAGLLIVEVQYVKPAPDGHIVVTDGGMTELIRPALYGAIHDVWPLRQESRSQELVRSWIVGPVCESADVLRGDFLFPPVQPGDLLAVLHAGAYGAVMGSTYNARPRPPEVLIQGSEWHIARRRETWADLIALET